MKIAIMQPYFFPFIGYYQFVFASDIFVSYNDVNFIEGGWINRNYILSPNGKSMITVPLVKPSPNRLINEIEIHQESGWKKKFKKTIFFTYKKAPFFDASYNLIENIIEDSAETIDELVLSSITKVLEYSLIKKSIYSSSQINYERAADKIGKILSLANCYGCTTILFPSGSKQLYRDEQFEEHGFQSLVVNPQINEYKQFVKDKFVSHLSIIDVLMFNHPEKVFEMVSNIKFEKLND
jgi:hypothetical protein